MKHICVVQEKCHLHAGKPVYSINNKKSGAPLAQVFWYQPWRQWCARFHEDSVWSNDCLMDLAGFLALEPKP